VARWNLTQPPTVACGHPDLRWLHSFLSGRPRATVGGQEHDLFMAGVNLATFYFFFFLFLNVISVIIVIFPENANRVIENVYQVEIRGL